MQKEGYTPVGSNGLTARGVESIRSVPSLLSKVILFLRLMCSVSATLSNCNVYKWEEGGRITRTAELESLYMSPSLEAPVVETLAALKGANVASSRRMHYAVLPRTR